MASYYRRNDTSIWLALVLLAVSFTIWCAAESHCDSKQCSAGKVPELIDYRCICVEKAR